MSHEYAFDVKLFSTLRVRANSSAEARAKLRAALDCTTINCGNIEGDPLIGEASPDGELELWEVDGEPV